MPLHPITIVDRVIEEYRSYLMTEFRARDEGLRAALVEALKTGQIACAGLDVFHTEPLPMDSELRKLDNVTLTDHAGWFSVESMVELKTKAAQNIADTLTAGKPKYAVKI